MNESLFVILVADQATAVPLGPQNLLCGPGLAASTQISTRPQIAEGGRANSRALHEPSIALGTCQHIQGVSRHWTPENLAKSQALYKHELDT